MSLSMYLSTAVLGMCFIFLLLFQMSLLHKRIDSLQEDKLKMRESVDSTALLLNRLVVDFVAEIDRNKRRGLYAEGDSLPMTYRAVMGEGEWTGGQ